MNNEIQDTFGYKIHHLKRRLFGGNSALKSSHRDKRSFYSRWVGLFGKRCPSYLAPPSGNRRECSLRSGHKKAHTDGEMQWGYGDNWMEM